MIEFIVGLFVLGTIPFWVITVVGLGVLAFLVEEKNTIGATIFAVVAATMFSYSNGWHPITWMQANPVETACLVAGYFAVGVIWSFVKWWRFIVECKEEYNEYRSAFLKHKGLEGNVIPPVLMPEFTEWEWRGAYHTGVSRIRRNTKIKQRPLAKENKDRIVAWMTYWPTSLLWTMLNDPVRRAFILIYEKVSGRFEKISEAIWADDSGGVMPKVPEVSPKTENGAASARDM